MTLGTLLVVLEVVTLTVINQLLKVMLASAAAIRMHHEADAALRLIRPVVDHG